MSQQQVSRIEQCANEEDHAPHPWGHRMRCPGKSIVTGVQYADIERLAALHHDSLRQWVIERLGSSNVPAWGGLTADAKRARIASMREVIKDLKERR